MCQRPHYFRQDTPFTSATAKGKHTSSCAAKTKWHWLLPHYDDMNGRSNMFHVCNQHPRQSRKERHKKLSQLVIKWGPRLRGFLCYCCLAKYELENFLGIKLSRMYGTPNKGIYRKVGENFSSHVPGASSEFCKTTSSQKLSPTMLRWLRTKMVPRGGVCSGFEEQR